MSTGLYEELGITADATTEQIRKAYKKRALQTHPDRLPPTATPEEKAQYEENFRKVNNAYEVLSDPTKRKDYDTHGIWPPPEQPNPNAFTRDDEELFGEHDHRHYRHHNHHNTFRSQAFKDAFFGPQPHRHHHHHNHPHSQFTDPFTLFDSIFGPAPGSGRGHHPRSQFATYEEEFFADNHRDPFGSPFGFTGLRSFPSIGHMGRAPFPNVASNVSPYHHHHHQHHHHHASTPNRGGYVAESYMTSTVNGVTQTIRKRVDAEGNEHITCTFPDGREINSINGIEQPSVGYISGGDQPNAYPQLTHDQYDPYYADNQYNQPPLSPHGTQPPVQNSSRLGNGTNPPPPPPYPGVPVSPTEYHDTSHHRHSKPKRNNTMRPPHVQDNGVYPGSSSASSSSQHLNNPQGEGPSRSQSTSSSRKWWQGLSTR